MLWSIVNISISSIRNAVYTLCSNSFSRGKVWGFSLICSAVLVFGEGFGAFNVQFLRVLSGFLNNPFYTQHFRTTVLGAAARVCL